MNEEKIWKFLKSKGFTDFGVSGLMGNLYAESGLSPINLQNSYEKKLNFTDQSYTQAVDNGSYTNFVKDAAGYGLAQWTYWSRKQNLLNYARSVGKSIGDLDMHPQYLLPHTEKQEGAGGLRQQVGFGRRQVEQGDTDLRECHTGTPRSVCRLPHRLRFGPDQAAHLQGARECRAGLQEPPAQDTHLETQRGDAQCH